MLNYSVAELRFSIIKLILNFNYSFDGAKLLTFPPNKVLYVCNIIVYLCKVFHFCRCSSSNLLYFATPLISLRYSAGVKWMIF